MTSTKSLDPYKRILASILSDIQMSHSDVITPRAIRLTIQKIDKRVDAEGIGFLTKTLPRLGKAVDLALSGKTIIDASAHRFESIPGSKLPKLFGELFERVFSSDGMVLHSPCVASIKALRQLFFLFYKLDVPYALELEQNVIDQFIKTEDDIAPFNDLFCKVADHFDEGDVLTAEFLLGDRYRLVRRARRALYRVFSNFNVSEITPRHGPGAVSTGERLQEKYLFRRYNSRIASHFPFDAYFCASGGHVCDSYPSFEGLADVEPFARVILVPKDSRGPRLISCEPLEFQWIQQGLGASIVERVEKNIETMFNIHFTDQRPNQIGALLGSRSGRYATLDLKEASDRVSVGLVRLLFPKHISDVLLDCRTLATVLPNGRILKLRKFAPMGSALCFPILALTIWAILSAGSSDTDTRESILVYGDDVIVPTEKSADAINQLESFGLLINRDKSYCQGLFRESCGVDAFNGIDVTPVRLKNTWASSPSVGTYASYIEFSNNLCRKGYYKTSDLIADWVASVYTDVPTQDLDIRGLALIRNPSNYRAPRSRWNKSLQKREYYITVPESRPVLRHLPGWLRLLRFMSEGCSTRRSARTSMVCRGTCDSCRGSILSTSEPFRTDSYTQRDASYLAKRWRG